MNSDLPNKRATNSTVAAKSTDTVSASDLGPESGWSLDKGVTRENNEDSLAAVTLNQASQDVSQAIGVYAVADGMGGHEAGEVASKLAIHTAVRQLMGESNETGEDMPEHYQFWLERAVALANKVVHKKAHDESTNMGTTLVMAVVVGNDVHIANVGDSRAYLISPSSIRQITHDQSMVQSLLDSGAITAEEVANHPRRNILMQSVGAQENVTIDMYSETLGDDESLLLCSDGLWSTLGDDEIIRIVRISSTPNVACQALVDACNAKGSLDNIAAVLVRPGSASKSD
jgi:serine/threonine protein phosphatase PrpC